MSNIIKAEPGETMFSVAQRACGVAFFDDKEVQAEHNGVVVSVYPDSYEKDIYEKLYYKSVVDSLVKNIAS
jgi:hypothetical protein